jgi:hypothetical protein
VPVPRGTPWWVRAGGGSELAVGQSWRWVRAGGGSELADRASSRPGRRSTGRCGPGSRATTRPSGSGGSLRSGARWGAPATIGCQHLGALLLPIEYAVMQQTVIAVTHRHIRIAGVLVVVEFVGVRSAPGFGPGPPRGNLGSPSPRWPRPQPDTSCVEGAGSADSKEMGPLHLAHRQCPRRDSRSRSWHETTSPSGPCDFPLRL